MIQRKGNISVTLGWGFPKPSWGLMIPYEESQDQYIEMLMVMMITAKRYKAKSMKDKGRCCRLGGNQEQAFKSPLPELPCQSSH